MNRVGARHHWIIALVLVPVWLICGAAARPDAIAGAAAPQETGAAAGVKDPAPVVLVGAGDIANCEIGTGAAATARVLDRIPGTVFTAGDHAYPTGSPKQFQDCYGPTWGRHKERTRPSPGNHDYLTKDAAGYFDYFGELAGPERRGYYSYTLGAWHIISLNSAIPAGPRSPQFEWLQKDLEENKTVCTLAIWHIPLFSSGAHGNNNLMSDVWKLLYDAHADVVINGHDHDYERFAPQNPKGKADPEHGIREFVVGTGGGGVYNFKRIQQNSEVRSAKAYGVIKLTLGATDYSWEFVQGAGEPFSDSGKAQCVQ